MKTAFHFIACFSLLYIPCILTAAQLGINIGFPERGGTFADVAMENHRWHDAGTGSEFTASGLDERGWPEADCRFIVDYRPVAEWTGSIDDPDEYRIDAGGTYLCSFTGQASVEAVSGGTVRNKIYSPADNTTAFDFDVPHASGSNYGLIILEFTGTKRTPSSTAGSGLTNFRMLRPDYTRNMEQVFTDDFLSALTSADFSVIRFMNFTGTNDGEPVYPEVTEWAQRKLVTDASQKSIPAIGKLDGAAWEYVFELANLLEKDVWINVPVSATDDYVTRLAAMLKDSLNPGIVIYVESSNEVWNTAPGFNQSSYNRAQAEALGIGEHENHARRTVELAQLFASVFGEEALQSRVRVILCSHEPMLKWWVEPMLNYISSEFGPPSGYIYALACQTYFGGGADEGESVAKYLSDCHDDITGRIDGTGTVNEAGRKQWIAAAAEWNLPGGFCSYEGGPSHPVGTTVNIANRIRAERDPGMADEIIYNLTEGFFEPGGNIAMHFALSSGYNRYGCWGLTDDISKPDRNYKYAAVREVIDVLTTVPEEKASLPNDCRLYQNYPNPFNPATSIRYSIPGPGHVTLKIYSILGREVRTLVNGRFNGGEHTVIWDGKDESGLEAASGIYFYRLIAEDISQTRKLLLLR